jgi:hypothetical protein
MGFTFDDTDQSDVANPIKTMRALLEKDRRNEQRIIPYIAGEEVNDSPIHANHRYVISFDDWPLHRDDVRKSWAAADENERRKWLRNGVVPLDYPNPVASDYPDLLRIVEEKVKPARDRENREVRRRYWWKFGERAPALYATIAHLQRVLAHSQVSAHFCFTFLPSNMIYAHTMNVFSLGEYAGFAVLQSRPHEVWARFLASSLEDRLRYNASDCFETFPFPEGFETDPRLEEAGKGYYEFRAELMVQNDEGLTKTYNRFHDPDERSNAIGELRRLHGAMDRAVLDAYGWSDLRPTCDFELEWEDEEDEANGRASRRKKPWRYRWPEETRDEVLARLLALNKERAEQERLELGDRRRRRA